MNSSPAIALGYTRVSTGRQELSLEAQAAAIQRAAEYHHLPTAKIFPEPETCRESLFQERKAGAELLYEMHSGLQQRRPVTIIVTKVDRFGSSVVNVDQTVTMIQKAGARIIFLDLAVDTSTPIGRAFMQISTVFAQLELARIRERIQTVLDHKKSFGALCGTLAYGQNVRYKFADGHEVLRTDRGLRKLEELAPLIAAHGGSVTTCLEDNADEQHWIRQMHEWRWGAESPHRAPDAFPSPVGTGEGQGEGHTRPNNLPLLSYHAIAEKLNALGVPTKIPAGAPIKVRVNRSASNPKGDLLEKLSTGRWQQGNVQHILERKNTL